MQLQVVHNMTKIRYNNSNTLWQSVEIKNFLIALRKK